MSHFTLLVTVDGATKSEGIEAEVTRLLAPFDENIEVTPYIKNTKQQLIVNEREGIRSYESTTYAKFLEDPKAYAKTTYNRGHLRYLGVPQLELPTIPSYSDDTSLFFWEKMEKEQEQKAEESARAAASAVIDSEAYYENLTFPEKLRRVDDDEFVFKLASRWFDPREDSDGGGQDTEGNEWSVYNPKSQWDWWLIGGRWSGMLNNTAGQKAEIWNGSDTLRRRDLRVPQFTFAYLTKEGEWVEKGSMGWFGMVSDAQEQDDWDKQMAEYLLTVPGEDWLVVVDCHI